MSGRKQISFVEIFVNNNSKRKLLQNAGKAPHIIKNVVVQTADGKKYRDGDRKR